MIVVWTRSSNTGDEGIFTYRFEPVSACVMCGCTEAKTLGRRLDRHQGLRPRRAVGVATTVVRCRECGLIYANPRPVPETLAQHYAREPERYWPPEYFEDEADYFGDTADRFRRLWGRSDVPRALDIGAGLGKVMAALGRQGVEAFGLEPSVAFRDRAIANGIDAGRLQLAAVEDAEYEADSFDWVVLTAVLEHLDDPASALARAFKWLQADGLMVVEVPSAKWLIGRLLNAANRAQGLDYVTNLSPMHPPYHLYEFTLDSFRHHAKHAGYKIIDHRFYACETFLPGAADGVAKRVMDATKTGMQLEVWLRRV